MKEAIAVIVLGGVLGSVGVVRFLEYRDRAVDDVMVWSGPPVSGEHVCIKTLYDQTGKELHTQEVYC